jgi:hypothetical protein
VQLARQLSVRAERRESGEVEPSQMIAPRKVERMMSLQDVILKASEKLTWIQTAEIAGISASNMQRKRQAYIDCGYVGLSDHREGQPFHG